MDFFHFLGHNLIRWLPLQQNIKSAAIHSSMKIWFFRGEKNKIICHNNSLCGHTYFYPKPYFFPHFLGHNLIRWLPLQQNIKNMRPYFFLSQTLLFLFFFVFVFFVFVFLLIHFVNDIPQSLFVCCLFYNLYSSLPA